MLAGSRKLCAKQKMLLIMKNCNTTSGLKIIISVLKSNIRRIKMKEELRHIGFNLCGTDIMFQSTNSSYGWLFKIG